jgi:hypothetical protein
MRLAIDLAMSTLLLCLLLQDPVDDLIKRLGGAGIEDRDAAARELVERARKEPAVRKRLAEEARTSRSPEVQGRLATVLVAVEWTATPAIPVAARTHWDSVSDGRRVVIWGGRDGTGRRTDGALYENGEWKKLPAADIAPRVLPTLLLSGDRLVVWSGGDATYFDDGAVYDLKALTVKKIPAAPIAGRVRPAVVDLGGRVLFWGGDVDLNDLLQQNWREPAYPGDGAILDLEKLAWTRVARAPIEGRRTQPVWTGRELVVAGGRRERVIRVGGYTTRWEWPLDGAVYDPSKDAWKRLPEAPHGVGSLHLTGRGIFAWGGGPGALLADGAWRKLPDAPVSHARLLGVEKDLVLIWKGAWGLDDCNVGAVLDLATEKWTEVPKCPLSCRPHQQAHWNGETLSLWGDSGLHGVAFRGGATWGVGAKEWAKMAEPPTDAGRVPAATFQDRRHLVLWGGMIPGEGKGGAAHPVKVFEDAAIYDAKTGAWRLVSKGGPLATWLRDPAFFRIAEGLLIVDRSVTRGVVWRPEE